MPLLASLIASITAQTAGREWAIGAFAALSFVALLCSVIRLAVDRQAAQQQPTGTDQVKLADFASFQRSYLSVYVVVMLADWLQGTHMYKIPDI